jgi:hypothetical protein
MLVVVDMHAVSLHREVLVGFHESWAASTTFPVQADVFYVAAAVAVISG